MVRRMSQPFKRPRDPNELAKLVVDIATGAVEETAEDREEGKNPHAVALGRLGGAKGGAARSRTLPPEKRAEIAAHAARKRWGRRKDG